ncbi:hypothetical protein GCM10007092_04170 [Thermus composti]|uniref:GerMN domain-containing protein n=1 Tax=Thermus composti TaxID=532059 RepID=A0ABV6PZ37_9DEIN|nr:GerMN domain-containing protein [Thermus composti]GGM94033.1 hypothetical protein GCM10007092_04170 [Thermus composti]
MRWRALLTPWNLFGLLVFLLGLWVYVQGTSAPRSQALPLPASEPAQEANQLVLVLYRPNPPQGFLRETETLPLNPGETPEGKALEAWAQKTGSPHPKALYRLGGSLVVDLPRDFARGLDARGEVYRIYSLAYSLLATFPQAQEVRFLVEGAPSPGLAHLDLSKPIRMP